MSALLLGVAAASGALLCAPSTMHRGLAAAPTMLRPHAASVRMAAPADDPSPLPPGAVLFDKAKHECYDYEAEAAAVERVVEVLTQLSGFGVEGAERRLWPSLRASCDALKDAMAESAAPLPINDPRLLGDWELVGTTSASFAMRGGLSGLGRAPFTGPEAIFVTFEGSGEVTAREVLKFFGRCVSLTNPFPPYVTPHFPYISQAFIFEVGQLFSTSCAAVSVSTMRGYGSRSSTSPATLAARRTIRSGREPLRRRRMC